MGDMKNDKKKSYALILSRLNGRYPDTMLGEFSKRRYTAFRILIGTILSARSRDAMTEKVVVRLFEKYRDASALASADRLDVEGIIHDIGFYRQKSRYVIETARLVLEKYRGNVPDSLEELLTLPGVGRKVANCVLVYAFQKDAIPVDTHVHRISNRLGWVKTKMPEQTERALSVLLPRNLWLPLNDTFVAHGKSVCIPQRPRCHLCRVEKLCGKVGVTTSGKTKTKNTK